LHILYRLRFIFFANVRKCFFIAKIFNKKLQNFSYCLMKRIIVLFFVVATMFLLYFQYAKYRKFSYPNEYDYIINTKEIDVNYHKPELVQEYFEKAVRLGNFAREQWSNYEIDVRSPENTPQAQNAAKLYEQMLARVKYLEAKLIASQKLKSQGYDNQAIALIEEKQIAPENLKVFLLIDGKIFKKGDENKAIWEIQKLINQKGIKIQVDGIFNDETERAVKTIQEQAGNFPSGIMDEDFVKLLLKK
jgi:murein L,D-transpeptidase YcbB/YkuD